jgi:hypothetical protein
MNAYGAGANDQENAKIERDYAIREATRIRRKGEKQLGDMYIAVALTHQLCFDILLSYLLTRAYLR